LEDVLMFLLLLILLLLYPFLWLISQIRRHYRLRTRGYWLSRRGRGSFEYEERHETVVEHLVIDGEMMAVGPDVIYLPNEEQWQREMPAWAQGRRDEILARVKRLLGNKNYRYEFR
jgi:hypothetical protein